MPESLYASLVGPSWSELPESIRRSLTPPIRAEGTMKVVTAKGGLAGLLVRMIQLPPAGDSVSASLRLEEGSDGMEWIRQFGDMRAVSRQTFKGDRMIECAGPFQIAFRCTASSRGLSCDQVGIKAWGVSLPQTLGPKTKGILSAADGDETWHVAVEISHPLLGMLCTYEGVMRIL